MDLFKHLGLEFQRIEGTIYYFLFIKKCLSMKKDEQLRVSFTNINNHKPSEIYYFVLKIDEHDQYKGKL